MRETNHPRSSLTMSQQTNSKRPGPKIFNRARKKKLMGSLTQAKISAVKRMETLILIKIGKM